MSLLMKVINSGDINNYGTEKNLKKRLKSAMAVVHVCAVFSSRLSGYIANYKEATSPTVHSSGSLHNISILINSMTNSSRHETKH